MRVGRSAIDEDAIRLLEQHNPDVQFDWTHILKATPQPAPIETVRERGFEQAQGRAQTRKERRAFPRAAGPTAPITRAVPDPVREEPLLRQPEPEPFDQPDPASAALVVMDEPGIGEDVFGAADEERIVEHGPEDRTPAAFQRLGSEGLARLRARYAEVMARIAERPMEDAAREELKLRAERLNPDGWVTADEVQQALEQYESVFEGVRSLVGTRRRRRRRRGQAGRPEGSDSKPEA
ncbi:MAG: hypothetical protein DMF84_18895 [Acidobacteria bacterium]|nr:MAG: hypothetical protein DMF84_18895 [Acidobacteriota bacterium]